METIIYMWHRARQRGAARRAPSLDPDGQQAVNKLAFQFFWRHSSCICSAAEETFLLPLLRYLFLFGVISPLQV